MTAKSTQDVLDALEGMKADLHKRKVTVNSNAEDVAPFHASHLRRGEANFKTIDQPISTYAAKSADKVMKDGKMKNYSEPKNVFTQDQIRQVFEVETLIDEHPMTQRPRFSFYLNKTKD